MDLQKRAQEAALSELADNMSPTKYYMDRKNTTRLKLNKKW
jgi:hypothetical protein